MRVSLRRISAVASAVIAAAGIVIVSQEAGAVPEIENLIVTATGPGGGPHVKLFTWDDDQQWASFFAYAPNFTGGVNVALGDVLGDSQLEIITGAGPGGGPHVKVFTNRGVPIDSAGFFAYPAGFDGGVNVGAADIDGDGDDEIITAPASGGGPHVKITNITAQNTPQLVREKFVFNTSFLGGVTVSGAYTDTSDNQGVVVAAGAGGGPHVRTFNAALEQVGEWFAYNPGYRGGVNVTTLPGDGEDGIDDIVTSSMDGPGHVRAFSVIGSPYLEVNFFAFPTSNQGTNVSPILDNMLRLIVAPYVGGPGVCPEANFNASNCANRASYVQERDAVGSVTGLELNPYPGFKGGLRTHSVFGVFDRTPPATTTTTPTSTSSSSTSSSSTSSSSTSSSSTSSSSTSSSSTSSSSSSSIPG